MADDDYNLEEQIEAQAAKIRAMTPDERRAMLLEKRTQLLKTEEERQDRAAGRKVASGLDRRAESEED